MRMPIVRELRLLCSGIFLTYVTAAFVFGLSAPGTIIGMKHVHDPGILADLFFPVNALEVSESGEPTLPEDSAHVSAIGPFLYVGDAHISQVDAFTQNAFVANVSNLESSDILNATITFFDGELKTESYQVAGYDVATRTITVTPNLRTVPAVGDTFELIQPQVTVTPMEAGITPSPLSLDTSIEGYRALMDSLFGLNILRAQLISEERTDATDAALRTSLEELTTKLQHIRLQAGLTQDVWSHNETSAALSLSSQILEKQEEARLLMRVLETRAAEPVARVFMTSTDTMNLLFIVANPLSTDQMIRIETQLPEEITDAQIRSLDGFERMTDRVNGENRFVADIFVPAGSVVERVIRVDNVWAQDIQSFEDIRLAAHTFAANLRKTSFEARARLLEGDIELSLAIIDRLSRQSFVSGERTIYQYRLEQEELYKVTETLAQLDDLVLTTAADRLRMETIRTLRLSLAFIILFSVVITGLLTVLRVVHRWHIKREAAPRKAANKRTSTAKRKTTVQAKKQKRPMSVRKIKVLESWIVFISVFIGSIFVVGITILLIMHLSLRHQSIDAEHLLESTRGAVNREDTAIQSDASLSHEPSAATGNAIHVRVLLEIPVDGQATHMQEQHIRVLSTQTGFLRVRNEPSLNGTPIGTVSPGDTFVSLDMTNGWYKIPFAEGSGWIFGTYVEVVEP